MKYVWVNKYDPKTGLRWMSRELVEEEEAINIKGAICNVISGVCMVGTAAVIGVLLAMVI